MERYHQLFYRALNCARGDKSVWFLAFVQIVCLFLALKKLTVFFSSVQAAAWAVGLLAIFSLVSVLLWLKIQAWDLRADLQLPLKVFLSLALRVWLFAVLGSALAAALKATHMHWTFFTFFSSLLSVSLAVCVLAAALYRQNGSKSLKLAIDFWRHKMSVMSAGAFVLIIAHGCSYYFAHAFAFYLVIEPAGRFSVSFPFATIWLLVAFLVFLAAICAGFLNAFLVLLFLDLCRPEKFQEIIANPVAHPAVNI